MIIERIQIDGFGLLRDRTFDLHGPLTVIYGENEAGKSTVMHFIRGIMLGFPSRNASSERFEPQDGGVHGGALLIRDEKQNRIRIERYASVAGRGKLSAGIVTVIPDHGNIGGETELKLLLGGISPEVYRSLFAFSLSELQELSTLQSDELSGYLYGAGFGAGGSVILAAEKKLNMQMEQLYKSKGKNQTIPLLVKELDQLEADFRKCKEQTGTYHRLTERVKELTGVIEAGEARINQYREQLNELDICQQCRSPWLLWQDQWKQLEKLSNWKEFPMDAVERLDALELDRERMVLELDQKQREYNDIQLWLEQHPSDETLHELKEILESLYEQSSVIAVNERTIMERKLHIEQLNVELDRLLQSIDPRWTENSVNRFAVSVWVREKIREYRDGQKAFEGQITRVLVEQEQEQRKAQKYLDQEEQMSRRRQHIQTSISAVYPGLGTMSKDDRFQSIQGIKRRYEDWMILQQQITLFFQQEAEAVDRLAWINQTHQQLTKQRTRFKLILLWTGMIVGLWGAVLWQSESNPAASFSLIGIGVIALVFSLLLRTPQSADSDANAKKGTLDIRDLRERSEEIEWSLKEGMRKLLGVDVDFQDHLPMEQHEIISNHEAAASLETHHDLGSRFTQVINELEQQMIAIQDILLDQRHIELQAADLNREMEHNQQRINQLEQQRVQEVNKQKTLTKLWIQWLEEHQLNSSMSGEGVLEVMLLVEKAKHIMYERNQLNAKQELEKKAQLKLLDQCRRQVESPSAQAEEIRGLIKQRLHVCDTSIQVQEERIYKLKEAAELERDLQLHTLRLERLTTRYHQLLEETQAADAEELRRNHYSMVSRFKLKQQMAETERVLEAIAGKDKFDDIKEILDRTDPIQLAHIIRTVEQASFTEQEEVNRLRDQRGQVKGELSKLEDGIQHAETLQKLEDTRTALTAELKRWKILAYSANLFKQTRELYEKEKQPMILQQASIYLSRLTGGHYVRVAAPFGEKRLTVSLADGRTREAALLSRGTAEQLYLAMRFALIDEMARYLPMPIVMDDIFVNFDPSRLRKAVELLPEWTNKQQVILYTCHPHIRDLVLEIMPESQLLVMQ